MSRKRSAYRPRPVAVNTLELALHGAAKPSRQDLAELFKPVQAAVRAMREGVATELQWSILSGSVEVAQAIERQGVVRGLQGHLDATDQALQGIYRRAMDCGAWKPPTLYYQELDALNLFVELHTFQAKQLGRAEFIRAVDLAQNKTRAQGHTVTVVRDISVLARNHDRNQTSIA
ncbi:hypothetical protein AZ34_12030 [Hylemonella gracilis str. Niagara R]|uniref:Uncharacterized protein n=1 Tax=Hylemonella gracilis str. Niagara R TaxID=1458275 RepID=A0A016XM36_9BURK|nr:hypothetical protein [Hylemonella gracilis]EYC52901.1 hypothetical protein AZ34_12030 [Hylemonella gracilis str. Niagara R]